MQDVDAKTGGGGDPELIALDVLRFVAERPEELERFLALSGVDPTDVPQLARQADFLGGILDFLLADEALLMVFSEEAGLSPNAVTTARRRMDAGSQPLDSGEI
jgi:hypothetical protein